MSFLLLTRRRLCASGAMTLLAGCTGMHDASDTSSTALVRLEGTAIYRERMALPPGATLEVVVEDVSLADAPAQALGRATVHPLGAPPIHFAVEYPAARILAGHRYGVRARIEHEGTLLFVTDTFNSLPPPGEAGTVELMLVRVPGPPAAALENTYWKLLRLDDTEVPVAEDQREPHMILRSPDDKGQRQVSGFAGCNTMGGGYTLEDERITFTHMAGTLRACEQQAMDTEYAFHQMLLAARRWAIRGQQLDLFDADGRRIALFESRYLR
ncbi:MAG: META domain-containing protein [Steroidobacteraceae bacterium]